ncbi:MAG: general secretion pathway protein GspK [Maricaulaceae bacterium]
MNRRIRQRGFALVAVLWILTLVSALAAATLAVTTTDGFLVRNHVDLAQARAAARAGITMAAARLLSETDPPPRDGAPWRWTWEGWTMEIAVQDVGGLVDLNGAEPDLLAETLQAIAPDMDANRLAAQIVDFRDADDTPEPGGAERRAYAEQGRPGPLNRPFVTVDELAQVLDMTPGRAADLSEWFTVAGGHNRVDPAVAAPGLRGLVDAPLGPVAEPGGGVFRITARAQAPRRAGAGVVAEIAVQGGTVRVLSWRRAERGL